MTAGPRPTTSMVIAFCCGWIASVGAPCPPPLSRHFRACTLCLHRGKWRSFLRDSLEGQLLFGWNWPQLSRQQEPETVYPWPPKKREPKVDFTWKIDPEGGEGPREIIENKVLGPRARAAAPTPPLYSDHGIVIFIGNHSTVSPCTFGWIYQPFVASSLFWKIEPL